MNEAKNDSSLNTLDEPKTTDKKVENKPKTTDKKVERYFSKTNNSLTITIPELGKKVIRYDKLIDLPKSAVSFLEERGIEVETVKERAKRCLKDKAKQDRFINSFK